MKLSEAIEKLVVGDTVWVKGKVLDKDTTEQPLYVDFGRVGSLWLYKEHEISITESQAEKVEVTEKQAELLRAFKGESIYELLANCLREDEELMAKAHLYSYTVKPKLYIVKNCCGEVFSGFYGGYSVSPRFTTEERYYCDFNDKSKAEAVAVLVKGTVEEV